MEAFFESVSVFQLDFSVAVKLPCLGGDPQEFDKAYAAFTCLVVIAYVVAILVLPRVGVVNKTLLRHESQRKVSKALSKGTIQGESRAKKGSLSMSKAARVKALLTHNVPLMYVESERRFYRSEKRSIYHTHRRSSSTKRGVLPHVVVINTSTQVERKKREMRRKDNEWYFYNSRTSSTTPREGGSSSLAHFKLTAPPAPPPPQRYQQFTYRVGMWLVLTYAVSCRIALSNMYCVHGGQKEAGEEVQVAALLDTDDDTSCRTAHNPAWVFLFLIHGIGFPLAILLGAVHARTRFLGGTCCHDLKKTTKKQKKDTRAAGELGLWRYYLGTYAVSSFVVVSVECRSCGAS